MLLYHVELEPVTEWIVGPWWFGFGSLTNSVNVVSIFPKSFWLITIATVVGLAYKIGSVFKT